jgi:hypothetical protein
MLLVTLAMAVAQRFIKGVHDKSECGKNLQGYAAMNASLKYADPHNLSNYVCESQPYQTNHTRKRSMMGQDTIVFLLTKLMGTILSPSMYILLLSKETPIFGGLETIITGLSSMHNSVFIVEITNDHYRLTLFCNGMSSSSCAYNDRDLLNIVHNLSSLRKTVLISYPTVHQWVTTINDIRPSIWCTPARPDEVWISTLGSTSYSHFAFPWSSNTRCRGYTIGTGNVQQGELEHRLQYEGRFNFYDGMISSVPVDGTCTDCLAMRHAADRITGLTQCEKKRPSPEHRLSTPSIKALEVLQQMIDAGN